MQTTTRNNQTLLDIAVQECGLALTDELNTGQKLDIVMTTTREESVVQELAADRIKPATAPSAEETEMVPYGGIGFMGIEIDFVVR